MKKEISNKKAGIIIVIAISLLLICIIAIIILFKILNNGENNHYLKTKCKNIEITDEKPIIYLYPKEETEITVKLGNTQNLTHTYPKYGTQWRVIAKPNGDLIDVNTGRNLYALYWEGINTIKNNEDEGFIVKGEDTIKFLEEKLELLGLNERESEEFIIYWLPKLESNKYNFIRFRTEDEINKNMPLEINPQPETIIRIIMEFKKVENPVQIQEQKLETPKRDGFTVVEWGGTEIN